jgi:hypothetical protein
MGTMHALPFLQLDELEIRRFWLGSSGNTPPALFQFVAGNPCLEGPALGQQICFHEQN